MGKKIPLSWGVSVLASVLIVSTVVAVSVLSRERYGALNGFEEPAEIDDTKLVVVQALPSGDLALGDTKKEVCVVFNHPLVPLDVLEEKTSGVFTIDPPVDGAFRWYGSRVCAFIPSQGWVPGKEYSVTVKKGLRSLNDRVLDDSVSFTFRIVVTPLEVYVSPNPEYSGTIDYDQPFDLSFNLPVDLAAVKKSVMIESNGVKYSFSAQYLAEESGDDYGIVLSSMAEQDRKAESAKKRVRIRPEGRLARDAEVKLSVDSSLSSSVYDSKMAAAKDLTYRTHGPLSVELKNEPASFQEMYNCTLAFNNSVSIADAVRAVKLDPPAKLRGIESGETKQLFLSTWRLQPGRTYTVTVEPFSDIYGNRLPKRESFTLETGDYNPYFDLETENRYGVIESEMKQLLPVRAENLPSIDVEYGSFGVDELQHQLESGYDFNIFDSLKVRKDRFTTGIGKLEAGRVGFDLTKYLGGKKGWVAVRLSADIVESGGRSKRKQDVQAVQSTDLGLTVKESAASSHVWVNSITSGVPVSGVTVTMYDASDKIAASRTDESGHCVIAKSARGVIGKSLYVAESKSTGDKAYVTTADHEVYMHSLTRQYDKTAADRLLTGQIFFDRRLYRPGDQVEFKAVTAVREHGRLLPAADADLDIKVTNARGEEIFAETKSASAQGGVWAKLTIPAGAPLGHYQVTVMEKGEEARAKGKRDPASVIDSFQVEEFRPVSFSVDLDGVKNLTVGQTSSMSVKGAYLFGAAMGRAPVKYTFYRAKSAPSSDKYPDFIFGDEETFSSGDIDWSDAGLYTSGEGRLSSDGKFPVNIRFDSMEAADETDGGRFVMSSPYSVKCETVVRDVDDRSVTKTEFFSVYPGRLLPGIKPLQRYQNWQKPFNFELAAIAPDGSAASGELDIRIIRREWKSILTKGAEGTVQYRNTLVRTLVRQDSVSLGASASGYSFTPGAPGEYTITVQERGGKGFSRISVYAFGGELSSWDFRDDDTVTIVPDKKVYRPGDTANLLVKSPFPNCRAIISLEREDVLWQKSIEIRDTGTPVQVPIKDEYVPNVYFSVMLIRPRVALPAGLDAAAAKSFKENDLGMPKFKIGIAELSVSNASRRAELAVQTDRKEYAPGDRVKVTIKTEPKAEVALSVADRGVLDIVGYRFTNPIEKIFRLWPLGVRILENRRTLIKQYVFGQKKGASPGGSGGKDDAGEGKGGFTQDGEDGTRRDIRYTAYWKPDIVADASGNAVVEFTLPHNLTTFRVMAVASAGGKYRESNSEIIVKKNVVVRKNLPRFIRPGDSLMAGAVVTNQTTVGSRFTVNMSADILRITGGSTSVFLSPGESKEIVFPVTLETSRAAGALTVKGVLSVSPADESVFTSQGISPSTVKDSLAFDFPVKESPPEEAFTVAGFSEAKAREMMKIPSIGRIASGAGGLRVTLSPTALIGLDKAFTFYATNPYYCIEQRASAYLLSISSGELLTSFSAEIPAGDGYDFKVIRKTFLGEITSFQNADGGFRFWKEHAGKSDPYLSAYIAWVLQESSLRGEDIPSSVLDSAKDYLRRYLASPEKDGHSYVLETFALISYTFALGGDSVSSVNSLLLSNEKKLSLRAKGYLAMSIARDKGLHDWKKNGDTKRLVGSIKNRMEITTQKVSFKEESRGSFERAFYSSGSTLGVIVETLMKLDGANPLIPQLISFAVAQKAALFTDSHSAGILALALRDYHEFFEKGTAGGGKAFLGGKLLFETSFDPKKPAAGTSFTAMKSLGSFGAADTLLPLEFEKGGSQGRLYYTASLMYAAAPGEVKARDEGFEVHRRICDIASATDRDPYGPVVKGELSRGKIYLCRVTVVCPKPFFNAVIVDPLPSTLEIVNTAFKTEASSAAKVETKAEVHNYWWEDAAPVIEYRDDQVVITQDYLSPGVHEFRYLVRPSVKGRALAPAASAKLMYEPEVFGRTAGGFMTVR